MITKRWARAGFALLLAGAVAGVAACGGDEEEDASPTSTATTKATAAATTKATATATTKATATASPKAATATATPKQ